MIGALQNSVLFKHVLVWMAASMLFMSFKVYDNAGDTVLRAGTSISLETMHTLRSDQVQVGQNIDFRVRSDVKVDGKTVIEAGTIARGQVIRAQRARGIGREGYVEVQLRSVQAVDGQEVILSGGNVYAEGDDKQTLSILLGVFVCILFLTMKGDNAEVPAGYHVTPTVASNMNIQTN
ncbi:MAG: hypothetical protein EA411_05115 [Saprospirales bacterium]|nr:MAG: hypothetical protein EA411_05115 [Saprospirales bacterium]